MATNGRAGFRTRLGRSGFALIMALFIMLVLGMLGVTLAGLYSSFSKGAVEIWKGQRALAVADGGLRWVFEYAFANDVDFSDNASPTDAPYGAKSVTLGPGKFWVVYGTKTQTTIDLEVTAQVEDVVRVVKTQLRVKAAKPLRKAIYATGSINLSGMSGVITGDVETESGTPITASVTGTKMYGSPYNRFQGVNVSAAPPESPFYLYANAVITGDLTLTAGSYGNAVTGYIWFVHSGGNVILQGPGDITIDGTIVAEGGSLTVQDSPTVNWTAPAKNIDGDAEAEMLPAFVADSVNIQSGSSITINGLICSRVGVFQWTPPSTMNLTGVLLAKGDVSMMPGGGTVNLTMTHKWDIPLGLDVPWLQIQGPDVEYEFAQWREQVSP